MRAKVVRAPKGAGSQRRGSLQRIVKRIERIERPHPINPAKRPNPLETLLGRRVTLT